jgi:hypothetical protein
VARVTYGEYARRSGMILHVTLSTRVPDASCIGCLGDQQCWVCLGQGRSERPDGGFDSCARCSGSGSCTFCGAVAASPTVRTTAPIGSAEQVLYLDPAPAMRVADPPVIRLDHAGSRSLFS